MCCSSSSLSLNMMRARRSGVVAGPLRQRRPRRLHRGVDLGGAGERDPARLLADRRIEHVAVAAARAGDPPAADPVPDVLHAASPDAIALRPDPSAWITPGSRGRPAFGGECAISASSTITPESSA